MNALSVSPTPSPGAQESCPICRDDLYDANKPVVRALPCGHQFHSECIYRWNTEHLTCPLGRRAIRLLELKVPLPPNWQEQMVNAASNGEQELVEVLLLRGAPVNANSIPSQTPFALAAKNKHINLAQMLATHGATDPWGQFYMGEIYRTGTATSVDMDRALSWYLKAANQGLSEAQYFAGRTYFNGDGVPVNKEMAVDWLKKAVAQNHADAQGLLGYIGLNDDSSDIPKAQALDLLHKAAEKGSALAQCKLGGMYWKGNHVATDLPRAHDLLLNAANQGLSMARVTLALFYYQSADATQMRPQIMTLLQQAVEQNNTDAMFLLAHVFWHKQRDTRQALAMLRRGAKLGSVRACLWLADIYDRSDQGVKKDPTLAMHYYKKAAQQNCCKAHYQLGIRYQSDGQLRDFAKALHHFEKAAGQGLADAQFRLGNMYWQGQGTRTDLTKAQEWFGKAAEQGHQEAKECMAKCGQQFISRIRDEIGPASTRRSTEQTTRATTDTIRADVPQYVADAMGQNLT